MDTEAAFLAAIREVPEDNLPRLVYADWLDDDGQPERAEFTRLQCRITDAGREHCYTDCAPPEFAGCPNAHLRRRERELFDRHAAEWFGERWAILHCGPPQEDSTDNYPDLTHAFVTRGFVERVSGPLAVLVGGERCGRCDGNGLDDVEIAGNHCPNCDGSGTTPGVLRRLCAEHPVTRVGVTDREPAENAARNGWYWGGHDDPSEPNALPDDVFALLPGEPVACYVTSPAKYYPTRDDALNAISTAIIASAKSGPPPATA